MDKLLGKDFQLLSCDKDNWTQYIRFLPIIGIAAVFCLAFFLSLPQKANTQQPEASALVETPTDEPQVPDQDIIDTPIINTVIPKPSGDYYAVQSVVDGDTIKVISNGKLTSVRLIGIDTPETVHPNKPVQCYGPEASSVLKNLLQGQTVLLESDPSQNDTDYYGRLLRYVWLGDENINEYMIKYGFAKEYTYGAAYKYQKQFRQAEANAKLMNMGMWGSCNY